MNDVIASVFLLLGLSSVFIGTTGVFGFSFIKVITRKQAITVLFVGFFSLFIAGRFNMQDTSQLANQQPQAIPQPTQETTSTVASNNKQNNLNQNTQSKSSKFDLSASREQLNLLSINDDFSQIPSYDRELYFGSWTDEDGDCQNTRAEVLIQESLSVLVFRSSSNCVVDNGEWLDPYTNNLYYFASELDVDHVVPLYNAWQSGAYLWNDFKREEFANDMIFDDHLIAVDKYQNRQKGAKDPSEWMPANSDFHCEYVAIWIEIKYLWELTITSSEYKFLDTVTSSC